MNIILFILCLTVGLVLIIETIYLYKKELPKYFEQDIRKQLLLIIMLCGILSLLLGLGVLCKII